MRTRKNEVTLLVMLSVVLGMLLLMPVGILAAPPQGVLKAALHWGLSADWLDPATAGLFTPTFPLYLFHDALLKPMPEGSFTPCLAESWTISPDKKVYEFKLRQGVKFHNGDTMTAEDVIFSFRRYKAAQAKLIHDRTEKLEAVNPHLVRIQFKEPFPDFLEYLMPGVSTIGWVVPKKYVEKVGDAGFKKAPIGCGPYKFIEFVAGVRLVGEAFEGYWRKVPNIKRMEFLIVTEVATRFAMVRRGETDIAYNMTDVFYEDVKKDPTLTLHTPTSPVIWLIYMAAQWDPKSPWSDPRIRKAASLAIDREMLIKLHAPGSNPAGSLGLESDPAAARFPADSYDPDRAKKLLAEAGYSKGFHGGTYYPYNSQFRPMGEMVANYWKAVGINVDTVLLDRPAWFANRAGGKMKGGIFVDPLTPPTIGGRLSYLFGSMSYGNYPDVQALWDRYNQAVDSSIRKDLITQIQRLIHEKTMYIPLRTGVTPTASGPRLKKNPFMIQPEIWWTCPFEDIELVK